MGYARTALWRRGIWADYSWHHYILGVVGISLIYGSTLGFGIDFAGELSLWFLCGEVLHFSALGALPVFNLGVLYMLGCAFPSFLGVGSLSLVFLGLFGFTQGGVGGGRWCAYYWV